MPANDAQRIRLVALAGGELEHHVSLVDLSDPLDTAADRFAVIPPLATVGAELAYSSSVSSITVPS